MLPYDPKYKKSNTLLSANESPLNVPDEVLEAVIERVRTLDFNRYPDPLANALRVADRPNGMTSRRLTCSLAMVVTSCSTTSSPPGEARTVRS